MVMISTIILMMAMIHALGAATMMGMMAMMMTMMMTEEAAVDLVVETAKTNVC